ncbi:DNA-3-methyladenine glycosylase 2 family protein [Alteromonas antoniana]|uniref:DNA-3-methyladenine glycosylase 2 family protein n=1 Tax=Alteromonas antoniana TaxID=2803813 RepID=UPI001FE97F14|nr:AlkA N-terminal domain-containing protein [Alteromonas antoniana]
MTQYTASDYSQARMSRDPRFDGVFFVGVTSTGIFCRPVCPARLPAEKNVRYFEHASHALREGFRPCLRCRPDSAPNSYAWLGVQTTVRRAEKLLSAIPAQSVSDIAARLGISERYLNKLVNTHFGVSPKTYQTMQKVLFAKQLLQQSALPVEQVALSCGFENARALQRAVKQYCKVTPASLRKRHEPVGQVPTLTLFLPYRPPYQWQQVRTFLQQRAVAGTETVTDNTYWRCLGDADGGGYVLAQHRPDRHGFAVTVSVDNLHFTHKVIASLSRVLDLHADPQAIRHALKNAGIPDTLIAEGLRLPGCWSAFEAGCRAILGQQVSVKAAINKVATLTHELGEVTSLGIAFPCAESVAESELTFLKVPGARKQALRDFARYCVMNAEIDVNDVLALKGIGPWTVNYLQMRGHSDPDIYLEGDLIVRKIAAQHALNPENAHPWRSYLTMQLWQLA